MKVNNPIKPNTVLATVLNRVDEINILQRFKDDGYKWNGDDERFNEIIPNPMYFRRNNVPYQIVYVSHKRITVIKK